MAEELQLIRQNEETSQAFLRLNICISLLEILSLTLVPFSFCYKNVTNVLSNIIPNFYFSISFLLIWKMFPVRRIMSDRKLLVSLIFSYLLLGFVASSISTKCKRLQITDNVLKEKLNFERQPRSIGK